MNDELAPAAGVYVSVGNHRNTVFHSSTGIYNFLSALFSQQLPVAFKHQ